MEQHVTFNRGIDTKGIVVLSALGLAGIVGWTLCFLIFAAVALIGLSLARVISGGVTVENLAYLSELVLWPIVIAGIVYRNVHTLPIIRRLPSTRLA